MVRFLDLRSVGALPKSRPHGERLPRSKKSSPSDTARFAEETALAALGSTLRIAAALSTVAAKTASLALISMASGADKFAQLVREEATSNQKMNHNSNPQRYRRDRKTKRPPSRSSMNAG